MSDEAAEIAENTTFLANEGYSVVMVLIPNADGTATMNTHGPVEAKTRALIEVLAGPALVSAILTAEAVANHAKIGDIPMVVLGDVDG